MDWTRYCLRETFNELRSLLIVRCEGRFVKREDRLIDKGLAVFSSEKVVCCEGVVGLVVENEPGTKQN